MTIPPLDFGRRLWLRVAAALLPLAGSVSAIQWATVFDPTATLCAALSLVLVLPATIGFATWAPVLERIELDGEDVVARWYSWGRRSVRIPLRDLNGVAMRGGSLRLMRRGAPGVVLRLPLGVTDRADRWVRSVRSHLRIGETRGPLSALARVSQTSHEGIRFELVPVFDPIPGFAAAVVVATGIAIPAAGLVLALFGGDLVLALWAGVALLAVFAGVRAALRTVSALSVRVTTHRLEVEVRRVFGVVAWSELLSDVVEVTHVGRQMAVRVRSGAVHRVPLTDLGPQQADALVRYLTRAAKEAGVPGGEVPDELAALVGQARQRPRATDAIGGPPEGR